MTDSRIDDLEARLMHQELAIEVLNETVTRQDRLIDALREEVSQLRQVVHELRPSPLGSDSGHEPPPHY